MSDDASPDGPVLVPIVLEKVMDMSDLAYRVDELEQLLKKHDEHIKRLLQRVEVLERRCDRIDPLVGSGAIMAPDPTTPSDPLPLAPEVAEQPSPWNTGNRVREIKREMDLADELEPE